MRFYYPNGLKRERYEFLVFDFNIVLCGYSLREKSNVRKRLYDILHIKYDSRLTRDNIGTPPELTDEIREEVKQQIIEKIKVHSWDEWKNRK